MKKRYILVSSAVLIAIFMLVACAPEVRIEDAPPTMPITPATTTVSPVTTPTGQSSDPTAKRSGTTKTGPATETAKPRPSSPVVVLESDEIVPIPDTLLMDLNHTLDELIESIGQLEAPDEDVLVFP